MIFHSYPYHDHVSHNSSTQPFLRRLITRTIGLIPAMAVAIGVGRDGLNTLLVASQVVLALVLPFIVFPLVWLTSSSALMSVTEALPPSPRPSVREILVENEEPTTPMSEVSTLPSAGMESMDEHGAVREILVTPPPPTTASKEVVRHIENEKQEHDGEREPELVNIVEEGTKDGTELTVDYSNGWFMKWLGYFICVIVLAANAYTFVVLGLGGADI